MPESSRGRLGEHEPVRPADGDDWFRRLDDHGDFDALSAFLEARLDEEEADARAALDPDETGRSRTDSRGIWTFDGATVWDGHVRIAGSSFFRYAVGPEFGPHIARQSPAVTLARVDAVRAAAGLHAVFVGVDGRTLTNNNGRRVCESCVNVDYADGLSGGDYPCETLLRLARAYRLRPDGSQHPDWRQEWEA